MLAFVVLCCVVLCLELFQKSNQYCFVSHDLGMLFSFLKSCQDDNIKILDSRELLAL